MTDVPGGMIVVAVDTGGTFTDVVALIGGRRHVLKLPSTPDDPARAVLDGIRRIIYRASDDDSADDSGYDSRDNSGDVGRAASPGEGSAPPFVLVHGSTVATNALLERTGARVALVTNRGFEDVIEIGRQNRPQLYAIVGTRAAPLVDRADRHGVGGRVGPDGTEEEPLDVAELEGLAARLAGAESVAVCCLHSYADGSHEERIAEAVAGLGVPVSVSSRLLPEYREFERTATTVVNAYVAPRMDRYLGRLADESGARRVRIMGSGGGAVSVARARREAVHTVLSGPAGGVIGALREARDAGATDIITFDMGGTSTDVSLCPGGPIHTREFTIAGVPVAVPVIDIHTVGAGGGSIAEVDAGGALRVGPRSAGADPGPICYGRGGRLVTVTDAHAWLGRLPPDLFLGGEARLDRAAIEAPLRALADRLGASLEDAAEGVLDVADTAMEGALRVISVERGHDPADFALVPFGGAAGLHAVALAERLGIPHLLVPADPGVLSAFGMMVSPVRKDVARSVLLAGDRADASVIAAAFEELETEAVGAMEEEGLAKADVQLRRLADVRYEGQSFELRVPAADWAEAFHRAHEARYGFARRGARLELVTLRVQATGPAGAAGETGRGASSGRGAPSGAPVAGRDLVVRYRGDDLAAAAVDRAGLETGATVEGPAVIHEYSATFWLPPGWGAEVLPSGSLSARRR